VEFQNTYTILQGHTLPIKQPLCKLQVELPALYNMCGPWHKCCGNYVDFSSIRR